MVVVETFFSLAASDLKRAIEFYVAALGARVSFSSPAWASLHLAGVRVGLFPAPGYAGGAVGLHFVVDELDAARAAIVRAGGRVGATTEVAPGVVLTEATDTEGNAFQLRQA